MIVDNTQLTIIGGFAPNSSSAEAISKALGSRTVMSGSVSKSKGDPSESLQMMERPLMTSDELKTMPKGQFIVMKTGFYPMKVQLKLFTQWGIHFDSAYQYPEHSHRMVSYGSSDRLTQQLYEKYCPEMLIEEASLEDAMKGSTKQEQKSRQPLHAAPTKDRKEQPDVSV